ncbi:MAG: HupE/UreJ family protein [Luteimonas sp.]
MSARFLWLLVLTLIAWPAQSHTLSVSHVDVAVDAQGRGAKIELDLALRDLALSLPLDANRDEEITWGELSAMRGQLESLVLANLSMSTPSALCPLQPAGLAVRRYDDGMYATVLLSADCAVDDGLSIRYGLFFEQDPQHRALLTMRRGEKVTTGIARAGASTVELSMDQGQPFFDYLREGIHHILIGYDHLAFLISLLLPAALIRAGRQWQPIPRLRPGLLHVVGVVSAFTVAHSITLALAALDWVTPASRWIEAAIAASVLLAALNNLYPVVTRRLWMVGFAFGLIHGFGFAGALGELGLPDRARLTALLSFNIGVELGQLMVVAIVMPVLFAVRHQRWYARYVMPMLSLLIAGLAVWWLIQRLAG